MTDSSGSSGNPGFRREQEPLVTADGVGVDVMARIGGEEAPSIGVRIGDVDGLRTGDMARVELTSGWSREAGRLTFSELPPLAPDEIDIDPTERWSGSLSWTCR